MGRKYHIIPVAYTRYHILSTLLPCIKSYFSGILTPLFLIFRPRVFSRALGRGAHRTPACTPRCKCGTRPGSVARALGLQMSRNLASNHGIAFRQARAPPGPCQPQKCHVFSFFFSPSPLLFLKYHGYRQRLGSHGTTTAALPSFSLCDSHERCFCLWVRARVRVIVGSYSACACVIVGSYSSTAAGTRNTISTTEVLVYCSFSFLLLVCCLLLLLCPGITP